MGNEVKALRSKKRFFNKGRRDLIARTFATLVQIAVGGAIAGNIFLKLSNAVKIVSAIVVVVMFLIAVAICPKRSDE